MTLSQLARAHGFVDAGVTGDLSPSLFIPFFDEASSQGWFGDMEYLERTRAERAWTGNYLPWARWALVVLDSYADKTSEKKSSGEFRVAAYARLDRDYHDLIPSRAEALARATFGVEARLKVCVDSAPVHERELAVRAGLGFFGKNGLFISPKYGSFVLLGVVFSDRPPLENFKFETLAWNDRTLSHCGQCTACLDACPTDAFAAPFRLNPQQCLSYWTIESKAEEIPQEIREHQSPWVFGCDVCQDVCPWNRFAEPTTHPVSASRSHLSREDLERTRGDSQAYFGWRGKSPMRRLSFQRWIRNISHFLVS